MDQSDQKVFKSLPIPISFATTCGDKSDRVLTSYLSIKCERQPFPILPDGVKEERLVENDEQFSNFVSSNDLNRKMKEETKEEAQTSLSSLASNFKVEVWDCSSVTTQLIIGQENQMKIENINSLPQGESSNKLMEDELFSLKSSYEGSKTKYSTQFTDRSKQSSDDFNMYNDTEQSIVDISEEDVQNNPEKYIQDNIKKCTQNQSDKAVQVVAKIVHTDSTNKDDEDESNCYYCGNPSSSKWHSKCRKIFLSGNVAAFSCNICEKRFKLKRSLTEHKSTHTGNAVVCEFCGALLFTKKQIDYHRKKHGDRSHRCSICFKTYHNNYYLLQHMDIHTGQTKKYLCHICGILCSRTRYYTHIRMHENIIKYICDICGRSFKSSNDLSTHLISHSSDINYNCALCNQGTKTKNVLMHHIKTKHPETMGLSETLRLHKKFPCSICNKTLSTKYSLIIHTQMHTGEKKYPCTICGKKLGTRTRLNIHNQMHKGGKKYQCAICGKRFLTKSHLIKHLISHTRVRNYKCDLCDKRYLYSYDMYQHKKKAHRKKQTNK